MEQVLKITKLQSPNQKVVGQVNKNNNPRTITPLDKGGNIITSPDDIAETFADYYANILREPHKKSKPGENRKKKNYYIINHSQTEN